MDSAEREKQRKLTPWERGLSGLGAGLLFLVSIGLHYVPPSRVTTETAPPLETVTKKVIADSDPSTIVIATLTAAFALTVYALNNRRVTSLSAGSVTVAADDPRSDPAQSKPETPSSEPPPLPILESSARTSVPSLSKTQQPPELSREQVWRFMYAASWNGKKVLLACALASKKSIPLKLQELCNADERITFDYAYGFLVAAASFGLYKMQPSADNKIFIIRDFSAEHFDVLRNSIIPAINMQPFDRDTKVEEIKFIYAFFDESVTSLLAKLPPPKETLRGD